VVVDVRLGSPNFGDHIAVHLTGDNHAVVWAPAGFAHGFVSLEESSTVLYECSAEWNPQGEGGLRWNDPQLGIDWPDLPKILSPKDQALPTLQSWLQDPRSRHFRFGS
jgi:dTDP-4-dehydrorhamnose 3,5-epimerase